jgi:hypothetical protein
MLPKFGCLTRAFERAREFWDDVDFLAIKRIRFFRNNERHFSASMDFEVVQETLEKMC